MGENDITIVKSVYTGNVKSVTMRAQRWREIDAASIQTTLPHQIGIVNNRRNNRRNRKDMAIQRSLEPWTSEFFMTKQSEDVDLNIVWTWVDLNAKPLWKEVCGGSPAVKAYYQQFESLIMKNNVLY